MGFSPRPSAPTSPCSFLHYTYSFSLVIGHLPRKYGVVAHAKVRLFFWSRHATARGADIDGHDVSVNAEEDCLKGSGYPVAKRSIDYGITPWNGVALAW